jgi:hypothetical protein
MTNGVMNSKYYQIRLVGAAPDVRPNLNFDFIHIRFYSFVIRHLQPAIESAGMPFSSRIQSSRIGKLEVLATSISTNPFPPESYTCTELNMESSWRRPDPDILDKKSTTPRALVCPQPVSLFLPVNIKTST